MRQDVEQGLEHLRGAALRAGQVEDEAAAKRAGFAARKSGARRALVTAQAGEFEKGGVAAFQDSGGSVGRLVARRQAGATGGQIRSGRGDCKAHRRSVGVICAGSSGTQAIAAI